MSDRKDVIETERVKPNIMDAIKWTVYEETKFPILVGEFQVATKWDFPSAKIGKRKLANKKKELAEELIMLLKEFL